MVRVVIADDHPLFVQALELTLTDAGIEVVGTAGDGAALLRLVEQTEADVVLLDLEMPGNDRNECLRELRTRAPGLKVIVLSAYEDNESINGSLAMGAVCHVGKTVTPADLAATVRIIAAAAPVYSAQFASPPLLEKEAPETIASVGLTRRELEILRLVSEGVSNGGVAQKLWVTEQTVKFHLSNIYRKLGVNNRTHAAAKAHSLGLTNGTTAERTAATSEHVSAPTHAGDADAGRSRSLLG